LGSERVSIPWPSDLDFPKASERRLGHWTVSLGLIGLLALGYPYLADLVRGPLLQLFPAEGLTLAEALGVVFGGPAVLFLIILSHETGHTLAGILAGLRFEMLAAGPVLLHRAASDAGGGLDIGLNRLPALMAGYSVCLPPRGMPAQALRRGMICHVAGGPGASLLVGILSLGIASAMAVGSGWESVARALLLLLGSGSLLVGLFTSLPVRGSGLLNDGRRWLELVRGGWRANRDLTLLTTSSRAMAGDAPKNWGRDDLEAATRNHDASVFEYWALRYLWLHLWDAGHHAHASRVLRRALIVASSQVRAIRDQGALDAARFSLWACGDSTLALEWQARTRDPCCSLIEDPEEAVASFFEVWADRSANP
jgi:hypothetical protein